MAWWVDADRIYERKIKAAGPGKPKINKGVQHRQLYRYFLNLTDKYGVDPTTLDFESAVDITEDYGTAKGAVEDLFEGFTIDLLSRKVDIEALSAMTEEGQREMLKELMAGLWEELVDLWREAALETDISLGAAPPAPEEVPIIGPPAKEVINIGDRITHAGIGESGTIVEVKEEAAQVKWDTGGLGWLRLSDLHVEG